MRVITFDIESKNTFKQVGSSDPAALDLALISIHDSKTGELSSYLEEDLPQLWTILEDSDLLVSFNGEHFDIPLLNKYYPGDLSLIKSLDLLIEVKNACGRRLKLDGLAEGTLGEKKSGHGLQAIIWWQNGEIDKIRKYCEDDVRLTRNLYDIAREKGKLTYQSGNEKFDIELDASEWENVTGTSMTHTLPF